VKTNLYKKVKDNKFKLLGADIKIINEKLPWSPTFDHKIKRKRLFKFIDIDDNKYLSLSECKKGIRKLDLDSNIVNDKIISKAFELSCKLRKKLHKRK